MLTRRPLRSALLLAALTGCHTPDTMSVSLAPDPAYTTDDLTLVTALSAGDQPKADRLDVSITWDVDGQAQSDLDGATTVPAARTSKGQVWTATAVAARKKRVGPAASASVTIANSLPVASATVDDVTAADADITADASATDADADDVTLAWVWTRNGQATNFTDAVVPASATARGETWEGTVTPNDGEEDGEPAVVTTTIDNVAPEISSVTVSPTDPTTDAVLTADVVAQDQDGDTVALRYEWLVNGVSVQDSESNTLDGALFDKHDEIFVRVTPNDGLVDGASVASTPITAVNSVPALASAAVLPSTVRAADVPTCVVDGWTDADGDPQDVLFEWSLNGAVVSTSSQLDASLFVKGDAIACVATPFDGEDQGAPVFATPIVVENTPPNIASAALSTTAPTEGQSIAVDIAGAEDADGDAITYTYRWLVNGVAVATTLFARPRCSRAATRSSSRSPRTTARPTARWSPATPRPRSTPPPSSAVRPSRRRTPPRAIRSR